MSRRPLDPNDPEPKHGTLTRHQYGCRCDLCREARRVYLNEWRWRTGRHKPREQYLAEIEPGHGTVARYGGKWGCRCDACRAAATQARARHRAARTPEQIELDRMRDRDRKRRESLKKVGSP